VPALIPVTKPVDASIDAIEGSELVHVPPLVVLVQVAVITSHIGEVPVIVCCTGAVMVTVCEAVLTQPPEVVTE